MCKATALDSDANPVAGAAIAWQSTNSAVATVSSSGLVTGVAAGPVSIVASSAGFTATAAITVLEPPAFLGASIAGPTAVSPNAADTWVANTNGGVAPFTYVWTVDGMPQPGNTDRFFTFQNLGQAFSVTVTVTDIYGRAQSTSLPVSIAEEPPCPEGEFCPVDPIET